MENSAGSLALARTSRRPTPSWSRRLRDAGAVILGKTNLSEWANFRSTRSTCGWSGRGGQTRNPYALDRNPCGSSAGSARDRREPGRCRRRHRDRRHHHLPVRGRRRRRHQADRRAGQPRRHHADLARQDTTGPMARSVADAAALLTAIAGADARMPRPAKHAARAAIDYTDPPQGRRAEGRADRRAAQGDGLTSRTPMPRSSAPSPP